MTAVETRIPQQSDMFPDDVPDFVVRYWQALRHWFEHSRRSPVREQLLSLYNRDLPSGERIELRTFDRHRSMYKRWLGSWPPKYGERPPWEHTVAYPGDHDQTVFNVVDGPLHEIRRVRTPVVDDAGRPAIRIDEYDTVTHRVIHSYIDFVAHLAAGLVSVATVLDLMSDGRLDGVIDFCHVVVIHLARG